MQASRSLSVSYSFYRITLIVAVATGGNVHASATSSDVIVLNVLVALLPRMVLVTIDGGIQRSANLTERLALGFGVVRG